MVGILSTGKVGAITDRSRYPADLGASTARLPAQLVPIITILPFTQMEFWTLERRSIDTGMTRALG
jgi:hypothetical protein